MTHIRHLVLNSCYLGQDLMSSLSGMKTLQRLYIGYPSLRNFPAGNTIMPYGERGSLLLDSLVEVEVMTELVEVIIWVLHQLCPSKKRTLKLTLNAGQVPVPLRLAELKGELKAHFSALCCGVWGRFNIARMERWRGCFKSRLGESH